MTDISYHKIHLLHVNTAYAITETCDKVIGRMDKY